MRLTASSLVHAQEAVQTRGETSKPFCTVRTRAALDFNSSLVTVHPTLLKVDMTGGGAYSELDLL